MQPETITSPVKVAKTAVSNLTLGSADDALTLATELQKFVKANKLTSNIQGKEFPNVEAWMFAGSLLGLSSMLESIEDRSTEKEIKWQAMVSITNTRTGAIVGRGFATCSNLEHSKRGFADYAICSMAQTRAVGKAYRLSLGWLMKAAGYEATPSEEMQDMGTSADVATEPTCMITQYQKTELLRLLQHQCVRMDAKEAALLTMHTWTKQRAKNALLRIKSNIISFEESEADANEAAATANAEEEAHHAEAQAQAESEQ